jgi:hypothetical protein
LAEAILRVSVKDGDITKSLQRAAVALFRVYPNAELFVNVTANVVLQKEDSLSVYFGQRFSVDREVLFGQEFDEDGIRTKKAETYTVNTPTDVLQLPTTFTTEYFGELFKKNFGASNVKVRSVINLIYKFTKGIKNWDKEKTTGQRWVTLF